MQGSPILRDRGGRVSKAVQIFSKVGEAIVKRNERLAFGAFEFDTVRSLLFRGGVPVALGRRGGALLAFMLKHRGEVLTKADLMDAAWPGLSVEEANLSVQISQLREVLGSGWITTLPRVGYRFRPAVESQRNRFVAPTVSIVPFADFETGAQAHADGFAEDLATALGRFRSLTVVGDEAAEAGYALQGSVRRIGECLRVNVRLIDRTGGAHLWAETADLAVDGARADWLVRRVAGSVDAAIQHAETSHSQARRPASTRPYDLYLRARSHLRSSEEGDNALAYGLLQQALEMEPENVHVLAAMVETLHHRDSVGWPSIGADDRGHARDLALRGLALGGDDAAAIGLFAEALFSAGEYDIARLVAERAVEINPGSSMALVCAGLGSLWLIDTDRAQDYNERAHALGVADPNQRFALNGMSAVQRRRGNYEVAAELARRALAAGPALSAAHWNLIASTVCLGRLDDARRQMTRYRALSPSATIATIRRGQRIVDERVRERFLGLLAEAGLPEA